MLKKEHKNVCLIISVFVAIFWLGISLFCYGDVSGGVNSADTAEAIGTAIGMAIVMPYLVVATVGTILHTIGGFIYKRGLVLAGLICECVAILLCASWGFGYIAVIIFGFIGFAKMKPKIIPRGDIEN